MSRSKRWIAGIAVLAMGLLPLALARPAQGEPTPAQQRLAMNRAIERGKVLWNQSWGAEGKRCAECHAPGPNLMRASRLKSYPKFDVALGKVVTGQQKLNQMITAHGKGTALPLGSDDLNALEAYISSTR